jgi:hypothetical protein
MATDDLKLVGQQLEDLMESQREILIGMIALQHNSKRQFEELGAHFITTVENVSTLTSATGVCQTSMSRSQHCPILCTN